MYVNGTMGVRGRGPSPPPPTTCATPEGGTHGGGSFNITSTYISLPQAIYNLHSTLHCIALTQTKRLRKEIKYILIYNNNLQSFVWSSIALKIHVSHFENWSFICGFSTKVTRAFLAWETMEKWRFQMPRYKWRLTWNSI